jgi:hypothetical protein
MLPSRRRCSGNQRDNGSTGACGSPYDPQTSSAPRLAPESLVIDANDPSRLAHWWAEVLGYDVLYETADEVIIGTAPA